MRNFIFEWEQEIASHLGLNTNDLLLLSYLHNYFSSGFCQQKDSYYRIYHKKIIADLPIITNSIVTLKRQINKLISLKILERTTDNQNHLFLKINYKTLESYPQPAVQKCTPEKNEGFKNELLPAVQKCTPEIEDNKMIVIYIYNNKIINKNILTLPARTHEEILKLLNDYYYKNASKIVSQPGMDLWISKTKIIDITEEHIAIKCETEMVYGTFLKNYFGILKPVFEGAVDFLAHKGEKYGV